MQIDWPTEFDGWLADLERKAKEGRQDAKRLLALVLAELKYLQDLKEPPARDSETATLKWVRQSRRYPLWRVSHPYREGIAVRLICWFPPGEDRVVVTLFAADKARMGDVFYNSVAGRADGLIDQWKREVGRQP